MKMRGKRRKRIIIIIKEVELVPMRKLNFLTRKPILRDHHRKTLKLVQILLIHQFQSALNVKTYTGENQAIVPSLQQATKKA
jgi:hypothetical protein